MSNTGSLSPVGRQLFWNPTTNASNANGFVATYLSGTSTPAATYTNAGLTVPNANPIALDSAGTCVIYLDPAVGSYKYQVEDLNSVVLYTSDPLTATNAGTAGLGEIFVFGSNSASPITATSYPSGATYDKLIAGSVVYFVDSGSLASGTYVIEAVGNVTSGNTLTVAIMDLDDGAPDTPLATLTITSTTGQRSQSGAISFAAPGTGKTYGIKALVNAGTGLIFGVSLRRTA